MSILLVMQVEKNKTMMMASKDRVTMIMTTTTFGKMSSSLSFAKATIMHTRKATTRRRTFIIGNKKRMKGSSNGHRFTDNN